jgi:MoxR-like ATPase
VSTQELRAARAAVQSVTVSEGIVRYITQIVGAHAGLPTLTLGGSPRASVTLLECSKLWRYQRARLRIPEDIKTVAAPCCAIASCCAPKRKWKALAPTMLCARV